MAAAMLTESNVAVNQCSFDRRKLTRTEIFFT
jgi:hypothetical protein